MGSETRGSGRAAGRVIGLVPAAGAARRLGEQPCSKEVLRVGSRAVCEGLLESFTAAGIERALVVLRRGKWDVPDYLGDGSRWGLHLAYLAIEPTPGVPWTLAAALPFVGDGWVALGFPDILIEPGDAFARLVEHRRHSRAEVVLGLFPTDRPERSDMVELDAGGRVRWLHVKQPDRGLPFSWGIALWGPAFSRFLAAFTERGREREDAEQHVGDVILEAIEAGLRVEGVPFPDGSFLDVGTPEDLQRARERMSTR